MTGVLKITKLQQEQVHLDGLYEALQSLPDDELQRLSQLPINKAFEEMVERKIVPNRATRRAQMRKS